MLTHTMFSQGDTSHDIYKWHADQRRQAGRVRSTSFAGPSHPPPAAFEHIHEPGGFRRNYMILRANEQGAEEPQILNNFIDFLLLFGHFVCRFHPCATFIPCNSIFQAGEDLDEDEDEGKEDDEEADAGAPSTTLTAGLSDIAETTPLLASSSVARSRSRSRRRRNSVGPAGNATVTQAVLMVPPFPYRFTHCRVNQYPCSC